MQGKVKYFNSDKGFGFISSESADIFVHVSQVNGAEIKKGDIVSYDIQEGKKGPEATNVTVVEFNHVDEE